MSYPYPGQPNAFGAPPAYGGYPPPGSAPYPGAPQPNGAGYPYPAPQPGQSVAQTYLQQQPYQQPAYPYPAYGATPQQTYPPPAAQPYPQQATQPPATPAPAAQPYPYQQPATQPPAAQPYPYQQPATQPQAAQPYPYQQPATQPPASQPAPAPAAQPAPAQQQPYPTPPGTAGAPGAPTTEAARDPNYPYTYGQPYANAQAPPPTAGYTAPQYNPNHYGAPAPYNPYAPAATSVVPAHLQYAAPANPYAPAPANPYGPSPYTPSPTVYTPPATPGAGRKKALLIGCCYPGQKSALQGCINDVQCFEHLLKTKFHFHPSSIVILRDDGKVPADRHPGKANILRWMDWLVSDMRPGDSLFFQYSGHGSQQVDKNGDEDDGYDETLVPTDFQKAGMIVDDEINKRLVRPLIQGVTLHAVIDACHSGTLMDLSFRTKYSNGRFEWKGRARRDKSTAGGTCFQFGACKDSQVAADTNRMSKSAYTGAATFSFIDAIENQGGPNQTYAQVLAHMTTSLKKLAGQTGSYQQPSGMGGLLGALLLGPGAVSGGAQQPVLSCDKMIDLNSTRLSL